jgi:hypothetical protein
MLFTGSCVVERITLVHFRKPTLGNDTGDRACETEIKESHFSNHMKHVAFEHINHTCFRTDIGCVLELAAQLDR